MGLRFDWFAGFAHVPRKEKGWAGMRFLMYGVAVAVLFRAWGTASGLAAAASAAVFVLFRRGWVD